MISFKDVGMSGVLCCIQREIQKAVGNELYQQSVTGKYIIRLRIFLLVVVQGPQIQHDYRVFRNKESFIPVVLNDVVILTQLVDRTPAKNFLQSVLQRTGNLDYGSNVRKVLFIFKSRWSITDNSIELFMCFLYCIWIRQKSDDRIIQCLTRRLTPSFNHGATDTMRNYAA